MSIRPQTSRTVIFMLACTRCASCSKGRQLLPILLHAGRRAGQRPVHGLQQGQNRPVRHKRMQSKQKSIARCTKNSTAEFTTALLQPSLCTVGQHRQHDAGIPQGAL